MAKYYWRNSTDLLNDISQTFDGGFIAGGSSFSGISGDKTTPNATNDGWILKLNATGSIEWQKSIRGNLFDILDNIKQTTDGGYIAGLYSESGIGLDKTAPSQGAYDYWIVKLDASGNIMWQNTIGGCRRLSLCCKPVKRWQLYCRWNVIFICIW